MRRSEVLADQKAVLTIWSKVEHAMKTAKTPVSKSALKKIEVAVSDLFEKLDMERINPNLEQD